MLIEVWHDRQPFQEIQHVLSLAILTLFLQAYWAAEQEAEEKRRNKRQEKVIKRWTRLVQGLRIRQRLQKQYSTGEVPPSSNTSLHDEQVGNAYIVIGLIDICNNIRCKKLVASLTPRTTWLKHILFHERCMEFLICHGTTLRCKGSTQTPKNQGILFLSRSQLYR
jgi:hypothetical protein